MITPDSTWEWDGSGGKLSDLGPSVVCDARRTTEAPRSPQIPQGTQTYRVLCVSMLGISTLKLAGSVQLTKIGAESDKTGGRRT